MTNAKEQEERGASWWWSFEWSVF